MKYKVYLDTKINDIPAGTYDVIQTNEDYDTSPTMATISFEGKEVQVPIAKYCWGQHGSIVSGQLIYKEAELERVLADADAIPEEKLVDHLGGLHHSEFTVEEFIQEFGAGDARAALKLAIRTDWDAMPISNKRMNEIFYKSLSSSR